MKTTVLALLASGSMALAGPMDYGAEPVPLAPGGGWLKGFFVGASVGYLHESEDEMWLAQLGIDLEPQLVGLDQAVFLEVGYNQLEFFGVEQEIIPVTLNYKLERPLSGPFSIYAGVGGGFAFYDVSGAFSADDEVFWGQIFGGLVYNVSESFELMAGVRGLYLDEVDLGGFTSESGDDLLWEVGARFNF